MANVEFWRGATKKTTCTTISDGYHQILPFQSATAENHSYCTCKPPRMCDDYWSEWKHCRSVRNLFHHYYTYGEYPSCKQWKIDYNNCREWEKRKSEESKKALCESEKKRLEEQKRHLPIWEMRKNPPAEWYLPLNDGKVK
ncbi:synaptic plasticity regulator PANTS isoform X1 [Mobula birostris]|uniref:synaptic plasticity regulator PANTS isoform X1 n=1 Tax=Mobula birostris TaxID=1983395 RepID=UPI003B288FAB